LFDYQKRQELSPLKIKQIKFKEPKYYLDNIINLQFCQKMQIKKLEQKSPSFQK